MIQAHLVSDLCMVRSVGDLSLYPKTRNIPVIDISGWNADASLNPGTPAFEILLEKSVEHFGSNIALISSIFTVLKSTLASQDRLMYFKDTISATSVSSNEISHLKSFAEYVLCFLGFAAPEQIFCIGPISWLKLLHKLFPFALSKIEQLFLMIDAYSSFSCGLPQTRFWYHPHPMLHWCVFCFEEVLLSKLNYVVMLCDNGGLYHILN